MKNLLCNIKEFMKHNWVICIILLISLILHILVLNELGYNYTLNSDDASYINSGITFLKTGSITMHGVISAQIMPGMTFLIALFALIFGSGSALLITLKIFWMLMGLCSIFIVYKIIRLYTNQYFAALPCIFFLAIDYVWMDNIILTETPFILLFSLFIYHCLKLSDKPNTKDYIFIVVYYILAVFIRPNIGIAPIFLAILLLMKKYKLKLLIKQGVLALVILLGLLIPWIYRNYQIFDKFIPLTYGMGNPLLLGTYQGVGYPEDDELDYKTNVDDKMSDDMRYYLENPTEKDYMTKYYSLEYDGMKAKYRMQEWWKKDKLSMLKSYLYFKPYELVYSTFYWDTVLGIDSKFIALTRRIDIVLFIISSLAILVDRKKIKEWLFLILIYGSQIALYAYTFAFSRYAITLFFIRYIIIGIGLSIIYNKIKMRCKKHESISSNTCV